MEKNKFAYICIFMRSTLKLLLYILRTYFVGICLIFQIRKVLKLLYIFYLNGSKTTSLHIENLFSRDMFNLSNKKGFEVVIYFLLERLNPVACHEAFRSAYFTCFQLLEFVFFRSFFWQN